MDSASNHHKLPKADPKAPDVCIAIVGMNGVGKSNVGKTLATKLRIKCVDTDVEFRKVHGKERDFIDLHGWNAFRTAEEKIICELILPSRIVVLGGGAIESEGVRKALKQKTIVVWIQASQKRISTHLSNARLTRPEFKLGHSSETIKNLLRRRNPLYQEVARVILPPQLRPREQGELAVKLLRNILSRSHRAFPQTEGKTTK